MPVHFEIQAADPEAAKAFYSGLFGWTYDTWPGFDGYFLVKAADIGQGHPITGAIMSRSGESPAPHSSPRGAVITLPVASTDESYTWALGHGGAEAMPPFDIEGVGRVAYVEDGQGNIVGMIQASM
ncbi:VOC family protein [Rhodobacterales bacterium HKCCE3408]|nr:VOC family protein [Rhodobacterales bacterium HKCCE3408]